MISIDFIDAIGFSETIHKMVKRSFVNNTPIYLVKPNNNDESIVFKDNIVMGDQVLYVCDINKHENDKFGIRSIQKKTEFGIYVRNVKIAILKSLINSKRV
ncbi:hypothetical protein ACMXYX_18195 (plasmid) [Neptuniibacter sp. QD72_48]|uniref:hypothetical protein n=1 Tax=Neptuniibacter sp. QD72_48 TaxID=3398214 RepID=UPI0039F4AE8A